MESAIKTGVVTGAVVYAAKYYLDSQDKLSDDTDVSTSASGYLISLTGMGTSDSPDYSLLDRALIYNFMYDMAMGDMTMNDDGLMLTTDMYLPLVFGSVALVGAYLASQFDLGAPGGVL